MLSDNDIQSLLKNWHSLPYLLNNHPLVMKPDEFVDLAQSICQQSSSRVEIFDQHRARTWLEGSAQETRSALEKAVTTKLIVIRQIQDQPQFLSLTHQIQSLFGGLITLNLYHNACMESGFPPHYDPHNLLIAQLYGSKKWSLSCATQNYPTSFRSEPPPSQSSFTEDIILNQGQMLYIPWGWWHQASPRGNSIHMSIGIRDLPFFRLKAPFSPA